MSNNLWILTEEKPKINVIKDILTRFTTDRKIKCSIDELKIMPMSDSENNFSFTFKVLGFSSSEISEIFIKIVSGYSSFVDFLIFFQENEPASSDTPLYAIEETKTDDSESRNTGVYQRATKFVYIDFFYKNVKKIMLYNLKVKQKQTPSDTSKFGNKCLVTLGVEIMGKANVDYSPFKTIAELIRFKNGMKEPPRSNTSIKISQVGEDRIEVSGKLLKDKRLSHDPNIGSLSLICASLRKLGYKGKIVITKHALKQEHITADNKFVQIASKIGIELDGLKISKSQTKKDYWKYEEKGEKLATIFIHIIVENFTSSTSIFDNHAGGERGYFIDKNRKPIPLEKYLDKNRYKAGDKSQRLHIPDLILNDEENKEIINIEGKKYSARKKGISELKNYEGIKDRYIKPNYPESDIVNTVVLFGSEVEVIKEPEVGFILNKKGKLVLGETSPRLFEESVKKLFELWKSNSDDQK